MTTQIVETGQLSVIKYGKVKIIPVAPVAYCVESHGAGGRWRDGLYRLDATYSAHAPDLKIRTKDFYFSIAAAKGQLMRRLSESLRPEMIAERILDQTMPRQQITLMLKLAVVQYGQHMSRFYYQRDEVSVGGGLIDVAWWERREGFRGFEVKSSRSDFSSDKKWPSYLPFCNRFSFVTLPGVIKPTELPDEIGLYEINIDNILSRKGEVLSRRRFPKGRSVEHKEYTEMLQRFIMRGTTALVGDGYETLLHQYAEAYQANTGVPSNLVKPKEERFW